MSKTYNVAVLVGSLRKASINRKLALALADLAPGWTLGLRTNFGRVTIDRPGGGLGGGNATFPSAGSQQDRFSTLLAATASYAGSDFSYDGAVQFSRFRWDYGEAAGAPGPQVETRAGFEVDGVQTKVRLDFGAGWVDYRGWHRVG